MRSLENIKKVVIKVGTSTLTYDNGNLNLVKMENIVRQIADLHNRGLEVVLVTSGAIGTGASALGYKERPKTIPEKQACAAVGQVTLIHMYQKLFSEYNKVTGQILMTREDIGDRKRYLNGRNTFFTLLDIGAIPIVNENDALVVDEIKFGDNDSLSAMVASFVDADLLIILSDIDGLYDSNPKDNKDAKIIDYVECITEEIESYAGGAGSRLGTGGMITKLHAAKICSSSGVSMIICNGALNDSITRAVNGENIGTYFQGKTKPMKGRQHWLAYEASPKANIVIDAGAEDALKNHKSLLPKGILEVEGKFDEGDVVSILGSNRNKIGHGIVSYNSKDLVSIIGRDTKHIEEILGYKHYDEIIHVNNMALF
ncbi:glutamate 5-kinase [Clostridium sp. C8-1-8]|uniref:glutamate 5-kinase n=1 Tax=Clostridium sp. C8-1-8 TaxID=2698831 RepID=UPI00136D2AB4|nr:glutamate 5-kinase [Clostridium sp. C8-1-8]